MGGRADARAKIDRRPLIVSIEVNGIATMNARTRAEWDIRRKLQATYRSLQIDRSPYRLLRILEDAEGRIALAALAQEFAVMSTYGFAYRRIVKLKRFKHLPRVKVV
jgi:hypothetical protein